jgi:hypothetical protein
VTEKRLTVILYGCDRNLWRGGPLKILVSDLFASGGPRHVHQGRTEEATLELRLQLPFDAGQLYAVTFSAPHHRPAWQFIRRRDFIRLPEHTEGDDLILRLMLLPDSPGTSDVAGGFERLQQLASPFVAPDSGINREQFEALDVAAQMALLNIEAKLRESILDGAPLLSFVRGVRHVAVDRMFVFFDAALKGRMPRSAEFADAAGHGRPDGLPELPAHPDSWKHTRFAEGNVQLSFSREATPLSGTAQTLVHSADVDIDLGRGLAHVKEWLENNVFKPGHKTNQALVYALLYAQGILPRYTLDPARATTRRIVPTLRSIAAPATARGLARRRTRRAPARRATPKRRRIKRKRKRSR